MSVFFDGRLITSPTTAAVVNDDGMRNQNLGVGNVVALVGRSASGAPKTALRFASPAEAKAALISGELLDAVLAAFDPSAQTGGPESVVAIRVNPAVQSTATLKNAADADVITLTSTNYGLVHNQIKAKIEAASIDGLRPTVQFGNDYYSLDNVGRRAMSLRYTGTEVTATATVTDTTMVLSAPAGTVVATLALTEYASVQDLADRINAIDDFTAYAMDRNGTKPVLSALDFFAAQDIKTADYVVRGDLQAVVDWFNSAGEGFVNAARVTGAGAKPAITGFKFLSGGSDGTTTYDDWADAFEVLQGVDVQWVTPVSSDAALHALADAHVAYMSDVVGKKRRAICGSPLGTTDAQAIELARALNSDRTSLVHLGHYNYGTDGILYLLPPYISAALVSGMFAGVNPGTPLTNKTIKVRGLERNLRNPTDTDVLINGGVMCLESTDAGYKVVKSISTWLADDNYNRVEQSTGVALDYTVRTVSEALDTLRGQKANPLAMSRAISIAESALRELARDEPQGPGILAGDDESPAYQNITASIEGDVLRVQFECSPVIPLNYVLVTVYAVPYAGASAA